jgi:DNA repair protein RadC
MAISDWPEDERPREKLLGRGPQALTDAELLAIFLRTGVAGKSAVDLARELLCELGGLRGLFAIDEKGFCAVKGLGKAKYVQLRAVLEMSRRYLEEEITNRDLLTSPEATRAYLKTRLRPQAREVFACLFLDNRHRVIRCEEVFFGTIDGASVHPREIVRRALELQASAVIFAHNHPSGFTQASQADVRMTRRLKDALALVDVRVLDHFIIGDGEAASLAEQGLM